MRKDTIEDLFKSLEGSFDLHDAPAGHERRFMERLQEMNEGKKSSGRNWWQHLSIAASIVILLGIGFLMTYQPAPKSDLASVSPEMMQTQTFFVTAINGEIEKLKSYESPETKVLIEDALRRVDQLDKEYQNLREDLRISGNDERVIHAMISNFQSRIDLLEQVVAMVEDLNKLKSEKDETII